MNKIQPFFEISDSSVLTNLHFAAIEDAAKVCNVDDIDTDIVNTRVTDKSGHITNVKSEFMTKSGGQLCRDGELAIIKKMIDFTDMDTEGFMSALDKMKLGALKGFEAYFKVFTGEKPNIAPDSVSVYLTGSIDDVMTTGKDGNFRFDRDDAAVAVSYPLSDRPISDQDKKKMIDEWRSQNKGKTPIVRFSLKYELV